MHRYLSDLTVDYPVSVEEDSHLEKTLKYKNNTDYSESLSSKINISYKHIDKIINASWKEDARVEKGVFYLMKYYGYNNKQRVGRMQSKGVTAQTLSRQLRYLLFKDVYLDVDLVNAHPTMLYKFACEHNIKVVYLKEYIEHRDDVLVRVAKEINGTRSDAKKVLLICLNIESTQYQSSAVSNISKDISAIREVLFKKTYNKTLLGKYIKTREMELKQKNVKITLQSIYCQNEETRYVLKLKQFIIDKLELSDTENLYPKKPFLSFIPFYDGAYINVVSGGKDFGNNYVKLLKTRFQHVLNSFNKLTYPIEFAIKEIEPNWSFIKEKEFYEYLDLTKSISLLTRDEYLKLRGKIGVKSVCTANDILPKIKEDILDLESRIKKLSKKTDSSSLSEITKLRYEIAVKEDVFSDKELKLLVLNRNKKIEYEFRKKVLELKRDNKYNNIINSIKEDLEKFF